MTTPALQAANLERIFLRLQVLSILFSEFGSFAFERQYAEYALMHAAAVSC
jgi:hypothetical protein